MHPLKHSILITLSIFLALLLAFYCGTLLHEWGHSTAAWLLGQKSNPFNINYGHGWFLQGIDESVDYNKLLIRKHGDIAAWIGISGVIVDLAFVLLFFILLHTATIQKKPLWLSFCYWSLIMYMVPVMQYFFISEFSWEGDTGRFVHGLMISPWWIFTFGLIFLIFALWRIFKIEIPKAYTCIPIKNIWYQRLFLMGSLFILFLLIYILGFNPLKEKNTTLLTQFLVFLSIILVPILFAICDPSRSWVRKAINQKKSSFFG